MNKITKIAGTGVASLALAVGFALPAAAQTQSTDCSSGAVSANVCPNINVDNSTTRTITIGNCSAIIDNNVDQAQEVVAVTDQTNVGGAGSDSDGGDGTGVGVGVVGEGAGAGAGGDSTSSATNEQNNAAETTATGTQTSTINFSPDCSTNNNAVTHTHNHVTHVAAAASTGETGGGMGSGSAAADSSEYVAQVNAPEGAVSAGAGGAVAPSTASILGLASSVAATALGLAFRKKMLL